MARFKAWLQQAPREHVEKIVSGVGGFLGILCVLGVSASIIGSSGLPLIVASMGASAVLLFAVPHGPLSQPWPLIGSHTLSAFIGVSVARSIHTPWLAGALAVGLAIVAMYYLDCIHPPGGATALTAVLGGADIHDLGFQFVLTPVLLNTLILLGTGVALNWFFPWRRYPASLQPHTKLKISDPAISHEHLSHALRQIGSFIDITEEDLAEIYQLARQHAHGTHLQADEIRLGGCYSNGEAGEQFCVRKVIDESPDQGTVIYRTLAGQNRRNSEMCTRSAFALWAKYEVQPEGTGWRQLAGKQS